MITRIVKKIIPKRIFFLFQPYYHFLLACFASLLYGSPSNKLIVIGVTGTTGKTTTVYLIMKILREAGYIVGCTSTSFFSDGVNDWANDRKMTMVGRFFIQKMLRKMVDNKCHYAIVETTSEGIRQFRHRFINYDVLVFTGLYPEHIESHGGFENYKKAKGELFGHLKRCSTKFVNHGKVVVRKNEKGVSLIKVDKVSVLNLDDENVEYFLNFWADKKIGYSKEENKMIRDGLSVFDYRIVRSDINGSVFRIGSEELVVKFLGDFNVINSACATCVGLSQGVDFKTIKSGLLKIEKLDGRMEVIKASNFNVLVDYAFEPRAMEALYKNVNLLSVNKIIHVLGSCGGGRDKSRRSILGGIAGERADFVVITNEDPYDDDPLSIIKDVSKGAIDSGKKIGLNLWEIEDRREAIRKSLSLANKGDLVLITGKGSEKGMCVAGGVIIPWDDRKVVQEEIIKSGL